MLLVGLTGGIGSGKSTVARMLIDRGAIVFDADELARRAVEPGTAGHAAVVERFGPEVLGPDGSVDRRQLARRVFADPEARQGLEAIVHPEVRRLLLQAVEPFRHTDRIVVAVVPLLVEAGMAATFDVVVVVSASEDERVRRLVAGRGMDERDVRSRIAAQATDEERERAADDVIPNDGGVDRLESAVDRVWRHLRSRMEDRPSL